MCSKTQNQIIRERVEWQTREISSREDWIRYVVAIERKMYYNTLDSANNMIRAAKTNKSVMRNLNT